MLKNILLLLCFALPVSQQARDFLYIVKAATVEYVAPTEDVLLASNSVVGIETLSGLGSATYIGGGLFLSAHHVVEGNEDQPLLIQDWHLGLAYNGFVVAYDLDSDLVIIGTNDPVLTPPAKLAWSDPAAGDRVHGVGFGVSYSDEKPGCERRIWSGLVSSYTENIGGHAPNAIKSTNPSIPGDSGGALFNDKGELIGVIHATDYVHCYSIRNACIHKLLRRLESVEPKEEEASGEDS